MKYGGFEGAVEHKRVEGDVDVPQDPGDDDEPGRAAVKQDQEAGDRDGYVHEKGDGGESDVELDAAVESPHLQQGRHRAQTTGTDDGASKRRGTARTTSCQAPHVCMQSVCPLVRKGNRRTVSAKQVLQNRQSFKAPNGAVCALSV